MADYSKLSPSTIKTILGQYSLTGIAEVIPQNHGISNSNYVVKFEDHSPVLLKVSNDKDIKQLGGEQDILLALEQRQFDYSLTPYLNKEGNAVYQQDGYHGVVYPFIDGQVPQLNTKNLKELANALGTLHKLKLSHEYLRDHTVVGFDLSSLLFYVSQPICPQDFKEAFEKVFKSRDLESLQQVKWETGVIHGDLYYDNSLFRDGKLLKIIDFEQSGIGEYILDLGISISGSCLDGRDLTPQLINDFVESYETVRPLPQNEKEFLETFIHIGLFSIALWRIKRFFEGNLDKSKAESYRELIERSLRYHEKV